MIYLLSLLACINANADSSVAHFAFPQIHLLPRQKAPYFNGIAVTPDRKFNRLSLNDYQGKYLVLLFYPFDFTYVCPTELVAFSDAIDKFKALNADVIGISTDSHFTHLAWLKTPRNEGGVGELKIPLLADISKRISKAYGVLVEDELDELYGAALRGLFIIDQKQVVRTVQINDAPVGRSVDETLRLIQALQYSDTHGEVCPANWKPGKPTIIPDQDRKADYFKRDDI
ncbi:hypothetical protein pb186bvf_015105 [Paramecium bursaria]